jgi:hypothetical protein
MGFMPPLVENNVSMFKTIHSMLQTTFVNRHLPCHLHCLGHVSDKYDVAGRQQEVVDGQGVGDKVLLKLCLGRVHRLRGEGLLLPDVRHGDVLHCHQDLFIVCAETASSLICRY